MSQRSIGFAGFLVVLTMTACQSGDAVGPNGSTLTARREAETRGRGGRQNDDTLAVHPARGRTGQTEPNDKPGEPEPTDDRGRGGKQNDDPMPHP